MNRFLRLNILLCFFAASASSWGTRGHRFIAEFAEKRLAAKHPKVLNQVAKLLGPGVSLAAIASCADAIRDFVRNKEKPDALFPDNCLVTREQAVQQFPNTASWHFVNIPVPAGANPAAHPDSVIEQACASGAPCIITQIREFSARLKNKNLPRESRALALMFLVHLVGDIHQPLHAVDRNKDRGGNLVWVRLGSHVTRLHSLWDTVLLESIDPATIVGSVNASRRSAKSWAWESYDRARLTTYKNVPLLPSAQDNPIVLPDPGYSAEAEQVIRERLHAAGLRLTDVLVTTLR